MDKNGDSYIQYTEFVQAANEFCINISDLYLKHAFELFDFGFGEDGSIPIDMLQHVMCGAISTKKKITHEEWIEYIEKYDENQDRMIDYQEFKQLVMGFHEFASNESKNLYKIPVKGQEESSAFEEEDNYVLQYPKNIEIQNESSPQHMYPRMDAKSDDKVSKFQN